MEWLAFKQAYEESTSLCNFSEKENLWRLRKCLRGAAKDAVSALLISATSPTEIISTLELQFGNPDIILSRIMMDIKKLSPLPNEYYKEIVPFSIKIKNYVAAVRALKRDEYLQGVNVANIVLSKLPTVLLTKWTDYSVPVITYEQSSRLDILSNFLNLEARKVSTSMPSLMNTRVDSRRRYSDLDTRQCVRQVRAKKATHRPWVILGERGAALHRGSYEQTKYCLRVLCNNDGIGFSLMFTTVSIPVIVNFTKSKKTRLLLAVFFLDVLDVHFFQKL
ncbi:hypothetical protein NE865_16204 [Phthorimaea operculella]|nr:hypothetical protein NE865_16204 [Phthorimaea operculella]